MDNNQPEFCPINLDNQFDLIQPFFAGAVDSLNEAENKALQAYAEWIDNQPNPPKSYHDHPIESEQQLKTFKRAFEKTVGMSLGAYLRIKRAYFILNDTNSRYQNSCAFSYITTPIGIMLAIFDQDKLCVLEFLQRKMLETELQQVIQAKHCQFVFQPPAKHPATKNLQTQLNEYFANERQTFDIPLDTVGTEFQREVWQTLQAIDYGTTVSYQQEAESMGKPTAMRAVANANGKNKISIIIPCHRVIRKSGDLGGYGGGLWRKRYLLTLEGALVKQST